MSSPGRSLGLARGRSSPARSGVRSSAVHYSRVLESEPAVTGPAHRAGRPPGGGEGDRMVGMLAIAAAAVWLLAFFLCAAATRLTPRWAGDPAPWPGLGGERPALVNLVATQGRLS